MTRFKLLAIMFKCRPYQSFLVGVGSSNVIVFVCLIFVSGFWIQAVLTGMISCNFLPMIPTVIIIRRCKGLVRTAVAALLFKKSPYFLQSLRSVFKLFC
jgi:hypothetical protein